ncbi:hypothetical protein EW026_g2596 [Hermanssonia centrifuga]|uniref:RING-type domain-containing protein n=1 Tax=Hermanssonia centrifuga TaxID=98765 RepID=A0A4S4KMU3_9APHY|nr:hypothetical protein EW026_g2596 [Hermanssonia centrifuga]
MPCGHMYCLDCATFWFNQGESPQNCACGRAFRGEDVIRLWASSDNKAPRSDTQTDFEYASQGRDVLDACNAALAGLEAGGQHADLNSALSKTQTVIDAVSDMDRSAAIQNLLKSLRRVLGDIRTIVKQRAQSQHSSREHVRAAGREVRQLREKMEHDIQEIYQQNIIGEAVARRENAEHKRIEEELRKKLRDVRRALDTTKRHLDLTKVNEEILQDENRRLTRSEVKYKKRQYYALRQQIEGSKSSARRNDEDFEDDSLMVI